MILPTSIGAILAIIVLVVTLLLIIVSKLPLAIGLLIVGLAVARLT